jgi:hypothetical protein
VFDWVSFVYMNSVNTSIKYFNSYLKTTSIKEINLKEFENIKSLEAIKEERDFNFCIN